MSTTLAVVSLAVGIASLVVAVFALVWGSIASNAARDLNAESKRLLDSASTDIRGLITSQVEHIGTALAILQETQDPTPPIDLDALDDRMRAMVKSAIADSFSTPKVALRNVPVSKRDLNRYRAGAKSSVNYYAPNRTGIETNPFAPSKKDLTIWLPKTNASKKRRALWDSIKTPRSLAALRRRLLALARRDQPNLPDNTSLEELIEMEYTNLPSQISDRIQVENESQRVWPRGRDEAPSPARGLDVVFALYERESE